MNSAAAGSASSWSAPRLPTPGPSSSRSCPGACSPAGGFPSTWATPRASPSTGTPCPRPRTAPVTDGCGELIDPPVTAPPTRSGACSTSARRSPVHSERSYQFASCARRQRRCRARSTWCSTWARCCTTSACPRRRGRRAIRGARRQPGARCCSTTGWSATGSRTSGTASRCTPRPHSPATRAPRPVARTAASSSTSVGADESSTVHPRRARPLAVLTRLPQRVRGGTRRRGARPSGLGSHVGLESVASVHVTGFVPTDFLAGLRAPRKVGLRVRRTRSTAADLTMRLPMSTRLVRGTRIRGRGLRSGSRQSEAHAGRRGMGRTGSLSRSRRAGVLLLRS